MLEGAEDGPGGRDIVCGTWASGSERIDGWLGGFGRVERLVEGGESRDKRA
jgi:hypothetical protein